MHTSFIPAVTSPTYTNTNLYCFVTGTWMWSWTTCLRLLPDRVATGAELMTSKLWVQRPTTRLLSHLVMMYDDDINFTPTTYVLPLQHVLFTLNVYCCRYWPVPNWLSEKHCYMAMIGMINADCFAAISVTCAQNTWQLFANELGLSELVKFVL